MDKNYKEEFTQIIKFEPPLYKQRYQFVKDLVEKYKPKKVADLGCADCSLLWMLKFCSCIEVLAGLDICANVMKEKMHTLSPLPVDYLQPSERSLTVTLHHGSVAHKDPCMLGFDLVTCIELIEHLEESELKKFPEVVFGFMAPSIVVISTPNSEFNSLLPRVMSYRHPDHKFEWSQAEFQSWALETARCYDYSVEFTGVGHPPTGMEKVGFCTQIGVFFRKYPQTGESVQSEKPMEAVYKTVSRREKKEHLVVQGDTEECWGKSPKPDWYKTTAQQLHFLNYRLRNNEAKGSSMYSMNFPSYLPLRCYLLHLLPSCIMSLLSKYLQVLSLVQSHITLLLFVGVFLQMNISKSSETCE
ncbi:small RNA 2'-O-methyltransferase isoform X2 [Passer montanus]|uniref:small RNA 2'-O-methyltransferase isoform X2 n=1 Tax=Passer montanus TaxID=9160 RepID=UPI00195F968A|nr:small RNA 2'-O-methyltransferase isoform X2 [Passer montanus]